MESIQFETQAHTIDNGPYDPTRTITTSENGKDIEQIVWPNKPHYHQLVEGKVLEENGIDLESWWADWTGTPGTLTNGTDFDQVVVAMPIECHRRAVEASPT